MNTTGLNADEIEALGGRIVTGDEIPQEILQIAAEMGIDPSQMRVIDMSGTILESLLDDARFLGEVVADEADFAPTPEGLQLTTEAQEFGASCGDPRCHVCYEPIGYKTPNAETAAAMADAREGNTEDVTNFFRQLIERMEARSLNQEDTPVPQQDEVLEEDINPFTKEMLKEIVFGQVSLQQSVNSMFNILKGLLEPEELEEVDHLTGYNLAMEQAAQIQRGDIIGQAKGFVLGRYGFEWEDVPYAQQRQVLEFFEQKNDA